jgi:hypothetical protein
VVNDARRWSLSRPVYVGLVAVQWLALALALASVNVHASNALRDYVSPSISDGYLLLAPVLLAGLLGLTVGSARILIALTFAMCVVAAAVLGGVLYSPAWLGITARTISLQNFATQQALFVALWTVVPAVTGGVAGYFLGGGLRRSVIAHQESGAPAWWDRQNDREHQDG